MNVSENTILITGGASGIGLALTKKIVELRNKVLVIGRDKNKLENAKKAIPEIDIIQCDITNQNDLDSLLVTIENNYPELNILINNAGIQYNYSMIDEYNLSRKIEDEIATNLISPIKLGSFLIPVLANKKEAAIINVTSALAISPKEKAAVYCATKAALHSFTKTLRYQCENTSIKIFELIPPLVDTEMTKGRGKNKISAEHVAHEFVNGFKKNRYEINVGKVKFFRLIHRISPNIADKILRKN